MTAPSDSERLVFLLDIVCREGRHLLGTAERLFHGTVDGAWVEGLEQDAELAERVDAFVARFGRMQDSIGDKLIPELRRQMLETPAAALDNLNRMEKLGLLSSVLDWIEARNLRDFLPHDYPRNADQFAVALNRAHRLVSSLVETYNPINDYSQAHFVATGMPWLPTLADSSVSE